MQALITQLQLLLAALGAFLPLVPDHRRGEAASLLETLADALAFGAAGAGELEDLAAKLKTLRAEIEAMGEAPAGAEAIEASFARVLTASAAFRAALTS